MLVVLPVENTVAIVMLYTVVCMFEWKTHTEISPFFYLKKGKCTIYSIATEKKKSTSVESHTGCCLEIVAKNPESTVGKGTNNVVVLLYHCCVCESAVWLY